MKSFTIVALSFALMACASAPIATLSSYDRNQIMWSLKEGTGKVEGDGFLMRRDGMLVKCAGNQVLLIAVSDYATERFTNIYGSAAGGYNSDFLGNRVDQSDSAYVEDARKTVCDVDGKFSFDAVPEGEYFITARVVWRVNNYTNEGGNLSKRVKVLDGQTTKVTLTN